MHVLQVTTQHALNALTVGGRLLPEKIDYGNATYRGAGQYTPRNLGLSECGVEAGRGCLLSAEMGPRT